MNTDLKTFYEKQATDAPHSMFYESGDIIDYMVYNRRLSIIAGMVKHSKPQSLIDIGCGEGFAPALYSKYVRGNVTGLDLSESRLQRCRTRCPGLTLIQGSATEIPFPDKSFDMALSTELVEHLPDEKPALNEFIRVARKNVLISVPNVNGNILSVFNRKGTQHHPLDNVTGHFREYDTRDFIRQMESDYNLKAVKCLSCGIYYTGIRFIGRNMPLVFRMMFKIYEPVISRIIKHLGYYTVVNFKVKE